MPVTPFHMGPGLALKSVGGNHFSLLAFGVAQVAMDIEPVVAMARGASDVHGWSHTYAGAAVIGALVLAVARPLSLPILRWWNAELRRNGADWLAAPDALPWIALASGAFLGTFSHVALDSIMHFDLHPFAPWSDANALLGAISAEALHVACGLAGVAGAAIWFASHAHERRA